ncbi:hypothetical protein MRX96_054936 [Rhipicephalus microplus]
MTAAPTGGYASPPHRPQIVGCYRCGAKGHGPEDCRFRSASCFKCKQRGHIARACCRRESGFGVVPPERQVHALSREEDTGTDGMFALEAADSHIGHVGITQPIVRTLDCGGVPVNMQVDTGSPVSVITWPTYERNKTVWPKLRGSPLKLTCFLGRLPVRGQLQLKVSCGNKSTAGSLQVLGCSGPNLCGRDLIQAFHMLEAPVMNVNTYRRTPQAGGRTPAQLLMGYDLRSRLDNAVSIPPSPVDRPPLDGWQPGEPVWVRNFGRGEPWTPASITSTDGARLVNADGPEGETIRRHSDQVKPRELEHDQGEVGDSRCLETAGGALAGGTPRRAPTRSEIAGSPSTPVLRRSGRQRKPPRPLLTVGGAE